MENPENPRAIGLQRSEDGALQPRLKKFAEFAGRKPRAKSTKTDSPSTSAPLRKNRSKRAASLVAEVVTNKFNALEKNPELAAIFEDSMALGFGSFRFFGGAGFKGFAGASSAHGSSSGRMCAVAMPRF